RGRRRRLLPRRSLSGLRPAVGATAGAARRRRPEPAEGGPTRLCTLEGYEGGGGHLLGIALGPWSAGLAHRVFRDGREVSRSELRDPSRRARPGLPASR